MSFIYRKKFTSVICIMLVALITIAMIPNKPLRADTKGTIVNVQQYCNMRTEPSTASSIVCQVNVGTVVTVLETVDALPSDTSTYPRWYKVSVTIGSSIKTGYIANHFIRLASTTPYLSNDLDFETMIAAFPESYKSALRDLHEKHPNWIFVPETCNKTWTEVLDIETQYGKSLIVDKVDNSWKSTADGCYDPATGIYKTVDSPNWVNASRGIVAYYMDPRNSMSESHIFQFLDLTINADITSDSVNKALAGSFMYNANGMYNDTPYLFSELIYSAGTESGVNSIFLVAKIIQEVGREGTGISSNGSTGYYNFYNIGAYSDVNNAALLGIDFARVGSNPTFNDTYSLPWNDQGKSIIGGAKWINDYYVSKGQNSIYTIRFNVSPRSPSAIGDHQYMTAIQSTQSEASTMYRAYLDSGLINSALVFTIPVYSGMPDFASPLPSPVRPFLDKLYLGFFGRPSDDPGANYWLGEITYSGITGQELLLSFYRSEEFAESNLDDDEFLNRLYETCLGREPDPDGKAFWQSDLNMHFSREYVLAGFINSSEFIGLCNMYGIKTSTFVPSTKYELYYNAEKGEEFVTRLYDLALGRIPDDPGFDYWNGILSSGGNGFDMSYGFVFSEEFTNKNLSNEDYVKIIYRIFLGREADDEGFDFWLDALDRGAPRFEIFTDFMHSREYTNLCLDAGFYPYSGYSFE